MCLVLLQLNVPGKVGTMGRGFPFQRRRGGEKGEKGYVWEEVGERGATIVMKSE